jgi:hypothetical protein
MIRKKASVDDVLEVLNRALKADPEAITTLRETKVPCNEELAKDSEIQCGKTKEPGVIHDVWGEEPVEVGGRDVYTIGFLGLLNGFFGIDERTGHGAIAAAYEVICPNCKLDTKGKRGLKVGDACPNCTVGLELGALKKFIKVDHGKLSTLEK